jgi:hypothetical protein
MNARLKRLIAETEELERRRIEVEIELLKKKVPSLMLNAFKMHPLKDYRINQY